MNPYDAQEPMKEDAPNREHAEAPSADQSYESPSESANNYSADNGGYSYSPDSANDGQGYTNPDGSHGFIYNSSEAPGDAGRSYRGAVIALSAVLATFVVGACCLVGAYFVAKSMNQNDGVPPTSDDRPAVETSGGLFIDDNEDGKGNQNTENDANREEGSDTGTTGSGTSFSPDGSGAGQSGSSSSGSSSLLTPAPSVDSILKLPADRKDTDGDGRAEIETDEQGEVLTSAGQNRLSVATVVHRVASSVVEITTETIVQSGHVGQYIASGAGSGVVISADGYVVTNHHVIDGANTVTVRMNDGTEFKATVVGTDEQTDIAVLHINPGSYALTVATLGSSFDLVVGEDILAIGNPLGSLGGTVTEGMISATARTISVNSVNMTLLQISAPINPGNSGGGLFNLAGELVGVVNAKSSGTGIEGLGFAIPINDAVNISEQLMTQGYVSGKPWLGITFYQASSITQALYYNLPSLGVYVVELEPGLNDTVFQIRDRVIAIDGKEISSISDISTLVKTYNVGDTIVFSVYRNGRLIEVNATCYEYTPNIQFEQ